MPSLGQKLAAEFIGTFALIFVGAGSICADQFLKAADAPGVGLLGIAAAHGLAIGIMVSAVGHISGGHFNPAVTLGFWVTKRIRTLDGLLYWAAQLVGAIVAAYLLAAVVPEETWRPAGLGTPMPARDLPVVSALALEGVLTFFLVFVVFATAVDERGAFGKVAGFPIGLTITMGMLVAGPLTGAALNPARALGPAVAASLWTGHGIYWMGPLLGGVLAAALYDALFLKRA